MKILLVTGPEISLTEPYSSGVEAFVVSLGNQLVRDGHTVDVVAANTGSNALFNCINPFTRSKNIKNSLIKRIIEKNEFLRLKISDYDVIHYHMYYPHLFKAGIQFNKPLLVTLHTPVNDTRIKTYQSFANAGGTIVSISERVKAQWEVKLKVPTTLIHNGINMDEWPLRNGRKQYLLWSGRINDDKNVAAAVSLAQHTGIPLKIAGSITDKTYFNMNVKPHLTDKIQYIGHISQTELSQLAGGAIAFLATAKIQESFGLAALEMLASGVPVIGFGSAIPSVFKKSNAFIVATNNWKDLIKPLEESFTIKPTECRIFASGMSTEAMSLKYEKLYLSVLNHYFVEHVEINGQNSALVRSSTV